MIFTGGGDGGSGTMNDPPSSGKSAGNSYFGMGSAAIGLIGDYFSGRKASNERKHVEQRMLDMDNTKHQREIRDLRKAGLNPILSATKGASSAGSVPGPAPVPQYGDSIRGGISTALQVAMLKANLDNTNADTAAKQASALLTGRTAANIPTTAKFAERYDWETREISQRVYNMINQAAGIRITNDIAKENLDWIQANRDKLTAVYAPTAYEREQIDKLYEEIKSGDMSPSTIWKMFIEFFRSR